MHKLLKQGFGMNAEERFNYLAGCETNVYQFCVTEMKQTFNSLVNQYLERKFSTGFKKDEAGNIRNWKEIEEPNIKDLFEVNKKRAQDSLEEFKLVGFPKHVTKSEEESDLEDEFAEESKFTAGAFMTPGNPENEVFRRKLSSVHFNIITESEINTVRTKFLEDIEA